MHWTLIAALLLLTPPGGVRAETGEVSDLGEAATAAPDGRELLVQSLLQDESAVLAERREQLLEVEQRRSAVGTREGPVRLAQLQAEVNYAEELLTDAELDFEQERGELTELAEELSEEQLHAFNESLQKARESGYLLEIDAIELRRTIEWDLKPDEIRSMVEAFTRTARRVEPEPAESQDEEREAL